MTITNTLARLTDRVGDQLHRMANRDANAYDRYSQERAPAQAFTRQIGIEPPRRRALDSVNHELGWAVRQGAQLARSLTKAGENLQIREATRTLRHAAASGDLASVHNALREGADINKPDKYGQGAVHKAAALTDARGGYPMAQFLLGSVDNDGNSPNLLACDRDGNTPLQVAARFGNLGFFHALQRAMQANPELRVNVSARNIGGASASDMTDNPAVLEALRDIARTARLEPGQARTPAHTVQVADEAFASTIGRPRDGRFRPTSQATSQATSHTDPVGDRGPVRAPDRPHLPILHIVTRHERVDRTQPPQDFYH